MSVISFLIQTFMSLMILGIGFIEAEEFGFKSILTGIICAITYFVGFNSAAEFSFSIRDYFICSNWGLFKKKFAWANTATLIVFITCYYFFFRT